MPPQPALPDSRHRLAAAGLVAILLVLGLLTPPAASSATEPAPDGSSVATAAASCWEIKRNDPAAPSGSYWLWTPSLMAPQQFHCDMERAGGGWVLVGRGREGWQSSYNGVGVSTDLLGPRSDFTTSQLPARTVDGLLDGRPVNLLREGIRVRRAMDGQGSTWQEVRFDLRKRERWAWTFGAGHPLGKYRFKSAGSRTKAEGGRSRSFGVDLGHRRVITTSPAGQKYTQGFAYGPRITAGPGDDSFLWSSKPGQGNARPYAEVYIRPRLLSSDFATIPAGGTAPVTRQAVASTWGAPAQWGVTGLASKRNDEGHVEVQAFAETAGRVYVGGNFTTVQRGRDATGADKVEQPYLAAFDLATGDFVPAFRTDLDGEVKTLEILPGGRLAVGGAFTRANGERARGVVVVDVATGATDPGFDLDLTGAGMEVRDLELVGDHLYVSGAFSGARGGGAATTLAVRNAVRVSPDAGLPDPSWLPGFNFAVNDSTPSGNGKRMYFAGHFTQVGDVDARRVAVVKTADGAPLTARRWRPDWSHPRLDYQRAIAVGQGRIWVGGSQHSLFSFGAKGYGERSSSITAGGGGDFQAISLGEGVLYAGCHCNGFNFQGADTYRSRVKSWSQADKVNWVGAWTRDGAYVPDFSPMMRSSAGAGVWATMVDSTGALWAGGDLRSVQTGPTTAQWVGSFARFPLQDHMAPSRPGGASALVRDGGQVDVSWAASTDESSAVSYEVLRNDRVVATTAGTSVTVPGGPGDAFFVRAVDAGGNRSPSTVRVRAE